MAKRPEEVSLNAETDYFNDESMYSLEDIGQSDVKNLALLSLVLLFALVTNLAAFPVILFRKTRFGNGQFAVLILCLTVADLLVVFVGILGALIIEAGGMSWGGTGTGCSIYYFFTSWLVGLSNYLIVCLVCMILVKRSSGILARLQECRMLLLALFFLTLLPALPELAIRETFADPLLGHQYCIISAQDGVYGVCVALKFLVRHVLPLLLVLLCIIKPRTRIAKRVSLILVGEPAACECGPSGEELTRPHECPKMQNIRCTPDLIKGTNGKTTIPALLEDPVRRKYKVYLAATFIASSVLYLLVDTIFQIQSAVNRAWILGDQVSQEDLVTSSHETNLATAVHFFTFVQQIISPLVFLYSEFYVK